MFTGSACDVLKCPGVTVPCNGHGACKSMQQLARAAASNGDLLGVTYGNTLNVPSTWDCNKIQGCDCTENYYLGPHSGAFGEFRDYDCSAQLCPLGADPYQLGRENEKQTLACTAENGWFALTFRQYTTAVVTTVEFATEQGDLPMLTASTAALYHSTVTPTVVVAELQKGTKDNIECSGRGICDRTTGVCKCFNYFLSSDGDGNVGVRGDCGYISPFPTIALS